MRIALMLCTAVLFNQAVHAQKKTEHFNQVWLGYNSQSRITDKWGVWFDAHLRTKEQFFGSLSQVFGRLGITYYINDNFRLTAGYAYVNTFPQDSHPGVSQPEHRPWQQLQWFVKGKRVRTMQWLRLDERFRRKFINGNELVPGYNFNYKLRYNFYLATPLGKNAFTPKSLSFVVNDEIHVNFGKQIVNNYFDQNRFFIGFAYHTTKTDNLQFGYSSVFQELPAGNRYKSLHVARIFYFLNLDFRKSKK